METYDTAPRPAPKAEGAIPTTVRFDPSEYLPTWAVSSTYDIVPGEVPAAQPMVHR
ncbi:hypothetical protein [Streptomyces sp. NPDC097610]|uniref:hypothetical protein n=1 Tax=Streptomyces sp. NPDC097610 TaxID=3157227 RepID=UPI00332AD3F8